MSFPCPSQILQFLNQTDALDIWLAAIDLDGAKSLLSPSPCENRMTTWSWVWKSFVSSSSFCQRILSCQGLWDSMNNEIFLVPVNRFLKSRQRSLCPTGQGATAKQANNNRWWQLGVEPPNVALWPLLQTHFIMPSGCQRPHWPSVLAWPSTVGMLRWSGRWRADFHPCFLLPPGRSFLCQNLALRHCFLTYGHGCLGMNPTYTVAATTGTFVSCFLAWENSSYT